MTEGTEDEGARALDARVFTPGEANGVTALVFGGGVELEPADIALSERFARWGALALAQPLSRDGEALSDRDATAMATAALASLRERDGVDPEQVVLAGLGRGGKGSGGRPPGARDLSGARCRPPARSARAGLNRVSLCAPPDPNRTRP